jgi:glycosyltransferase involved in cell wall biosynthesis
LATPARDGGLRIVMLAPPPGTPGPMPRLAELLAEGLRSEGCDVVTSAWGGRSGGSVLARTLARARELARARRVLGAVRPGVVLVQTSLDWASAVRDLALAAAARGRGRRIVLEFHGGYCDRLISPGHTLFKQVTALLLRLVDGAFVLSTYEQRALAEFRPRGRFYAVTNPFRPPAGDPTAANGAPREVPVVLFGARLVPEKGVLDTVDALAVLRERLPVHLVVAGDGPAADAVRQKIRERGLAGHVTLTGHLTQAQLLEHYGTADVFVLPTYHPEGFPTSLSEAMNAGLPLVTSSVRGIGDHLVEGRNALFVPPRDPAAIAAALERVLTDPGLSARMAAANREKVKDFAPERVARDYVVAFEQIVSG